MSHRVHFTEASFEQYPKFDMYLCLKKMLVIYFVHANVKINVLQASPTYKNSGSSWKIPGARNSPMVVYSPTRDSRADSASIHSASSSRSSSTR